MMKLENDLVGMLLVDVDGQSLVPVIKKSKGKGGFLWQSADWKCSDA